MGKLKSYQEQIQEIVDKGINAAEEQQKKLASMPFDYAEKLESEARAKLISADGHATRKSAPHPDPHIFQNAIP